MGDAGRGVRFVGCCVAFLIYLYGVNLSSTALPVFIYVCMVVSAPVFEELIKAASFMAIGGDARWRIAYAVYFGVTEQIFRYLDRRAVDIVAIVPILFHVMNACVFIKLTRTKPVCNALAVCIVLHYVYNITVAAIF